MTLYQKVTIHVICYSSFGHDILVAIRGMHWFLTRSSPSPWRLQPLLIIYDAFFLCSNDPLKLKTTLGKACSHHWKSWKPLWSSAHRLDTLSAELSSVGWYNRELHSILHPILATNIVFDIGTRTVSRPYRTKTTTKLNGGRFLSCALHSPPF